MPSHQLVRKGVESGCRIWSVWDPAQLQADSAPRVQEVSEELLLTDLGDDAALAETMVRVVRRHGIDAVLHCGDGGSVLPVVRKAWQLGLSPNPPAVYERLHVREEGDRAPVEAPRVSVETLTVNGTHHVVGVTAQRTTGPPHFFVTGHLHPAPLTDDERKSIKAVVEERLTASGYRFGPAHTVVALLPHGPRIVSSAIVWNTVMPALGVVLILGAPILPALAGATVAAVGMHAALAVAMEPAHRRRWMGAAPSRAHGR